MFKNLNTDSNKKPRLLGELGDLSHAKVSSGEFKYGKGTEIFGQAEPADYIYQVIEGAVRSHKLLSDGRRQIGAFHLPGDIFGLENGISIVSQPKPSWTPPFALLNVKAWSAWPKPIQFDPTAYVGSILETITSLAHSSMTEFGTGELDSVAILLAEIEYKASHARSTLRGLGIETPSYDPESPT